MSSRTVIGFYGIIAAYSILTKIHKHHCHIAVKPYNPITI